MRKERVQFLLMEPESEIKDEKGLRFLIGDKASSVGGLLYFYPFRGRDGATRDIAEELGELNNLLVTWKVNFGRKNFREVV